MQEDKRRIEESIKPIISIIIGIALLIASGMTYLNISDGKTTISAVFYAMLSLGLLFTFVPFFVTKGLFKKLIANKKTLFWVNDALLVAFIIGIAVLLTYIGFRRNIRYDFTYNNMLTLSEQTLKVVRGLEKDVEIYAFFPQGLAETAVIEDLLKEYKRNSSHLTYKFVDPTKEPMIAQAMKIKQLYTIVVQSKNTAETTKQANGENLISNNEGARIDITARDLFSMPMNEQDKPKFTGEQSITSAIMNVSKGNKRKVAFVTGHGEFSKDRDLKLLADTLELENINCVEVNLMTDKIPEDVNMLFIAAPKEEYHEDDMKALEEFAKKEGKNIVLALDYEYKNPLLEQFALREYGVAFTNDLIIDTDYKHSIGVVPGEMQQHEITVPIKMAQMLSFFHLPRSLNIETKTGLKQTKLVESRFSTIGKRLENINGNSEFTADELVKFNEGKDIRGPFTLAALVERNQSVTKGANAIFFSDGNFLVNGLLRYPGNKNLVLNSINYGVGQLEMVSVEPKSLSLPQISFDRRQSDFIFSLCLFAAPAFIIMIGLMVFISRKKVR